MSRHSRRAFMVRSAAAGTLALGATDLLAQQATPANMTIAKWAGPEPDRAGQIDKIAAQLTKQAIDGLGGMKRFVSRGDVVWVKPNIAWDRAPELAANTHPDVVATVVQMCFDAGAKVVKVGDNPCHQAEKTYVSTGIPAAAKAVGAQIVMLDRRRVRQMNIGGDRVKSIPMFPEILDVDVLINVPIAKHHRSAGLTLCMKNYMGVIEERRTFHQALPESLTDLTRYMKPRTKLQVLDCVRVLDDHGPAGGDPADVQVKTTVAAGIDPVALDAFAAELMGRKLEDVGSIILGDKAGLGTKDYRSLSPREIDVT